MTPSEVKSCLTQQRQIVDKMLANIEVQNRFLGTPHMKGLHRMIKEQALLIAEFSAIRQRLFEDTGWQQQRELYRLFQIVSDQYETMIEACNQLLQAAIAKRKGIAAAISSFKQHRRVNSHYVRQWQVMTAGHRFSVRG